MSTAQFAKRDLLIPVRIVRRTGVATPDLEERKKFCLWVYAKQCFRQVVTTCDFLLDQHQSANPIRDPLNCAVIVTYAKPFFRCYGFGLLSVEVIPKRFRELHAHILLLRNKAIAHIDASDFKPDDSSLGNIHQIRIKWKKGDYSVNSSQLGPLEQDHLAVLRELCDKLSQKADYHTKRFLRDYVECSPLPDGEYTVSVDSKEAEVFVPVSPRSSGVRRDGTRGLR